MIELNKEMRAAFLADHEDACDGLGCGRPQCLNVRLAAVLFLAEREVRAAVAAEIEAALAADQADSDVSSGEAIWEQGGYRSGLAAAADIARGESS